MTYKYFIDPFAIAGDVAAVPDAAQPDGSVSYSQGYGPDYALNPVVSPSALLIERTKMNQLFLDITTALQQYQQHGTPPFITSAMNGGTPYSYSKYDRTLLTGVVYQSLVNTNTDTPPSANWAIADVSVTNVFTGGVTTGSASAQVLASTLPATGFSLSNNGQVLIFTSGFTPTGATTLQLTSPAIAATEIKKPGTGGSLISLTGNEWGANETVAIGVNTTAGCYELLESPPLGTAAAKSASDNTKTFLASISGSITSGHVPVFADTVGTIKDGGPLAVPFGAIAGCLISALAGANTTATATVGTGQAVDSANAQYITSAGYSWAVANGNAINGYSGGATLPNSTTIHMYLATGTSGTGVYAIPNSAYPLAAGSAPTGYQTAVRRIGSFNTGAGGAPLPYTSIEKEGGGLINWLGTQVLDVNVSNLGASRTAYALSIPLGVKVQPIIRADYPGANYIIFTSGDETDVGPNANPQFVAAPGHEGNDMPNSGSMWTGMVTTNTSGQIGARSTTTGQSLQIVTRGWIDYRRN